MFDSIYNNVKVFEFEHLYNSPENVFKSMAEEKGFSFTDFSLVNAKLNSLPNRFLLYNNFTVEVDGETEKFGAIWAFQKNQNLDLNKNML